MQNLNTTKMKDRKKRAFTPLNIVTFIVLALYCVLFISLLIWGLLASLKDSELFYENPMGLPDGWLWQWKWSNFPDVAKYFIVKVTRISGPLKGFSKSIGFWEMVGNTLLYTVPSAFIATFVPCLTAYLVAKFPYALSRIVYTVVIVAMILPIVGSYPSEIQVLRTLGLYDSFVGSWIQKANFLGMYFLVFFAMFKSLPNGFAEAAYIDGANEFSVFFRIILPLVRTTFSTVMLIRFVEFWNDYQVPLLYMPTHPTLSFGLYTVYTSTLNGLTAVPMRMACTILIIIPIIVIFLLFKNRLMGNLTVGGLKG